MQKGDVGDVAGFTTQLSSEVCPAAQPRCWGKKKKQQVPDIAESEPSLALNIQQFLTHLLEHSYGQVSLKNRCQKIAQKILFNFIFFYTTIMISVTEGVNGDKNAQ